ncbi:MAG TPA: LysR family transcriptional regulator [Labilithrix sp.]
MDLLAAMTTFLRVADSGSLSKAARDLRVTPAAVSRQLSALEEELGATLIVRTTRQVSVTEEGRRFYEHAERTVAQAEEARASVRTDHAVAGLVTVSVPTALGLGVLDVSLPELVAANPGLRIDLRLEDHPVDLLTEGVDVAVRAGLVPPDTTTLVAQPLALGERVVVAAPSYLRSRGEPTRPADLARHDGLVHLHAGADVGVWTFASGEHEVRVEVHGPIRTNALYALRNAALAGAGIAVLPRFVVAEDLDAKRLQTLSLSGWQPRSHQIYALVRAEARSRARVRALLDHLRERLGARVTT